MKLTKKELLNTPHRKFESQREYSEVYVIPAGTKHDSGFMHLAVIGMWVENGEQKYEMAGRGDVIQYLFPTRKFDTYEFALVRQDCYYPSGVSRYFGSGVFLVSGISSIDLQFIPTE